MAEILKGAPVAAAITEDLIRRAEALKEKGVTPCLAIVRLGERPEDLSYERGAMKRCEKVGIRVEQILLPAACLQEELEGAIRRINAEDGIHGCLLFRPLPKQLDERAVCEALAPAKDVDCMSSASLNAVFTGRGAGFAPCTAQSVLELLDFYGYAPAGKRVAVIGRSLVIGKPLSMLLLNRDATVTVCHSKTPELAGLCREAEILVAAAGKAGLVDERYTNPGQVVVDVGIHPAPGGGVCGDVDFARTEPAVKAVSPVPGGVGSVTTAVLCKHVIEAAEAAAERRQGRT